MIDGMQMEVRPQLLVPGVQHQGDAESAAEIVAAELEQASRRPPGTGGREWRADCPRGKGSAG